MFAKLKKKIETESGTVGESPGRGGSGGGLSRHSSVSSLSGASASNFHRYKDGPSPPGSVTSEDCSMKDVTSSREEVVVLLHKKTEQCKKLESNISDLAALIKDKSKNIEKLETQLKQQEEVTAKKLQKQREEFDHYRDKLIEGYQEDKLQQDKLLNTEEALTNCQSELESKSRQCQAAENQVEKLTDELGPLKQRLTSLESESVRLKEEISERAGLVTSLTKEKSVFDNRLHETNLELTEKQSQISKLHSQLADLEGELQTTTRNSDLHKNKTNKLLQEKDDHISTLQERVKMLEQRIFDSSLSGDDRTSALQAERDAQELKLSEARQQLAEIKSTWSDKISQLEEQISHLNAKLIEDSEELSSHQKNTDHMRENFQKQIEDFKLKLEDAEKRALENFELASSKDMHNEKQVHELEQEIGAQRMMWMDTETNLRSKVTSLEAQLSELEVARQAERDQFQTRITHLEEREAHFIDMELRLENEAKQAEQDQNALQVVIRDKEQEMKALQEDQKKQNDTITNLKKQILELEENVKTAEKGRADFEKHLRISQQEKEGLLERNAELHQQLQAVKMTSSDSKLELQRTLELKTQTITNLQKSEGSLRERLEALEKQYELSEISKAESGLYSERIDQMTCTISTLQAHLTEKTKTVKKQEQTLKDLRLTLQRELKVQSLPNDESMDQPAQFPYPLQKNDNNHHTERGASPLTTQLQQQQYPPQQQQYHNQHFIRGNSQSPTAAVLPIQSTCPISAASLIPSSTSSSSSSAPSGAMDALTVHTNAVKRDLDKDVNFLYLKHVVLKFMLSREAEAVQLIKAVSMLLNFTHQEQQLIKDTLEWKMSWFGHRPSQGKGQTSKDYRH